MLNDSKMNINDNRIVNCIETICDQFNIPATLRISSIFRDRTHHTQSIAFIDVLTASHFSFEDKEILDILAVPQGIKSKKDYRKLRSLVRTRLIDGIWSLRSLTEESLRNLGVKI